MTPGRFWEASTATQVVDEVLRCWFEDSDQIDEVLEVDTTRVADRERLGYRLVVSNPDGRFIVEQQAYYETSDGLISWMRAMCSGLGPWPTARRLSWRRRRSRWPRCSWT